MSSSGLETHSEPARSEDAKSVTPVRELEFRAWNQDSQAFAYFVFCKNGHYTFTKELEAFSANAIQDWQQFTGLKDKNSRKIYEGDIVCYSKGNNRKKYPVEYRIGSHRSGFNIAGDSVKSIEVIGNIYENPDLLAQ